MTKPIDLICFSHLRWHFVFQRPQYLMSRAARQQRVFFFEEPIRHNGPAELLETWCPLSGVAVLTPYLPEDITPQQMSEHLQELLKTALVQHRIDSYLAWYYTPMALEFTAGVLAPAVTVYDCMDELSAFAGAPPRLRDVEADLFCKADLVFAGGRTLFDAKQKQHRSVHLFPSSVDTNHFAQARISGPEPLDQASIPRPRLGYAGVIDERMDLDLVRLVAAARPAWQFVFLGPVAKVDPAQLPQAPNIHYLGMKSYADLPAYMSGWKIGLLPFALNESTRFISPTKTPEYLAAGLRVLSTPIRDVIYPYGENGLASIVRSPESFVDNAEHLLATGVNHDFLAQADDFLAQSSWDATWCGMSSLIDGVEKARTNENLLAIAGER